jgi:hypothetical protein
MPVLFPPSELQVRVEVASNIMPLVIGLHAPKGTGKDTTALAIERLLMYRMWPDLYVSAMADPLYAAVAALTDKPVAWLQDQRNKNRPFTPEDTPIETLWGKTPRMLLELMGTEFVRNRISPNHWVAMKKGKIRNMQLQGTNVHIITDIRFVEEVRLCDAMIELRRPGVEYGSKYDHISTQRLPSAFIDDTIWLDAASDETYRNIINRVFTLAVPAARLGRDLDLWLRNTRGAGLTDTRVQLAAA